MLTISKFFIKISVKIITLLKAIIVQIIRILTYPLKIIFHILRKILFRPISFIFINIRTFFTKGKLKLINLQKFSKKQQKQSRERGIFEFYVEKYRR